MYLPSEECPRRESAVHGGDGTILFKDLAAPEQLYHHCRMFSHLTIHPGCSLGPHGHSREVEYYYILRGNPLLDDNGTARTLHPGGCGRHRKRGTPRAFQPDRQRRGADRPDHNGKVGLTE